MFVVEVIFFGPNDFSAVDLCTPIGNCHILAAFDNFHALNVGHEFRKAFHVFGKFISGSGVAFCNNAAGYVGHNSSDYY